MATAGEDAATRDALPPTYGERTQALIESLLQAREATTVGEARRLLDAAHAAVLEEAGHELRQVLTHLRTRLELARHRRQQGQDPLDDDELTGLLGAVDRAAAVLDASMDRNETAKRLIPIEAEAFDLGEELATWLEREGLHGKDPRVSFPTEPAPVRGDRVKLAKAIGSLVQHFLREAKEGERVVGHLRWDGPMVRGFAGLSPSHLTLGDLMDAISSPLPVGDLRFNFALVRAVIERHGGSIRVARGPEDALGFAFEIPALASEVA